MHLVKLQLLQNNIEYENVKFGGNQREVENFFSAWEIGTLTEIMKTIQQLHIFGNRYVISKFACSSFAKPGQFCLRSVHKIPNCLFDGQARKIMAFFFFLQNRAQFLPYFCAIFCKLVRCCVCLHPLYPQFRLLRLCPHYLVRGSLDSEG